MCVQTALEKVGVLLLVLPSRVGLQARGVGRARVYISCRRMIEFSAGILQRSSQVVWARLVGPVPDVMGVLDKNLYIFLDFSITIREFI